MFVPDKNGGYTVTTPKNLFFEDSMFTNFEEKYPDLWASILDFERHTVTMKSSDQLELFLMLRSRLTLLIDNHGKHQCGHDGQPCNCKVRT